MKKAKRLKKPSWLDEFKEFAVKGNAMALAVGTIIGAAFSTITKSLTNDIIMPVVNIFLGGTDFSAWKLRLPYAPWAQPDPIPVLDELGNAVINPETGEAMMEEAAHYLTYGNFISAIINFLILALVVFFIVRFINRLSEVGKKKEEAVAEPEAPAEPPAPPAPSNEEVLLAEIRDLLKNK